MSRPPCKCATPSGSSKFCTVCGGALNNLSGSRRTSVSFNTIPSMYNGKSLSKAPVSLPEPTETSKEEDRLVQVLHKSQEQAIPPQGWTVQLKGIPEDEGLPVTVSINNTEIFKSKGASEAEVTTTLEPKNPDLNNKEQVEVELDIPILATTITRSFKKADGLCVKFEIRAEGLAIVQTAIKVAS